MCLITINSFINPIIYCVTVRQFALRLWSCCLRKTLLKLKSLKIECSDLRLAAVAKLESNQRGVRKERSASKDTVEREERRGNMITYQGGEGAKRHGDHQ